MPTLHHPTAPPRRGLSRRHASSCRTNQTKAADPVLRGEACGNKIAPGWFDHYLARNGVDRQRTDEPEDTDRPDNLWHPLPGDRGAHGQFNHLASASSWQLRADMHRGWLAAAAGGCVAGLAIAALMASRSGHTRSIGPR